MSRGPGKWQRGLLAALDEHGWFELRDALPEDYTRAEYQAAWRAAWQLCDRGAIDLYRPALRCDWRGTGGGRPFNGVWLTRRGFPLPKHPDSFEWREHRSAVRGSRRVIVDS